MVRYTTKCELDDAMIEPWRANLERCQHAGAVDLDQDVVREIGHEIGSRCPTYGRGARKAHPDPVAFRSRDRRPGHAFQQRSELLAESWIVEQPDLRECAIHVAKHECVVAPSHAKRHRVANQSSYRRDY